MNIIWEERLTLTTSQDFITWEAQNLKSTIDLIFISDTLFLFLIQCQVIWEIEQSSDYLSVLTVIQQLTQAATLIKRWLWKKIDQKVFTEVVWNREINSTQLLTVQEVDNLISEVHRLLEQAIDESVPWAHSSPQAQKWWIKKCAEIVKTTWELRRIASHINQLDDYIWYQRASNWKKSVICTVKVRNFWEEVQKISQNLNHTWKFIWWVKSQDNSLWSSL